MGEQERLRQRQEYISRQKNLPKWQVNINRHLRKYATRKRKAEARERRPEARIQDATVQQKRDNDQANKAAILFLLVILNIITYSYLYWIAVNGYTFIEGLMHILFWCGALVLGVMFLSLFFLSFNEAADDWFVKLLILLVVIVLGLVFLFATQVGGFIGICLMLMIFIVVKMEGTGW